MSRREARRRLQEADPNLKIVSGRRASRKEVVRAVPRVLTPEEARQWGLPEMIPIFPPQEVIAVEARWSKKQLQEMATEYFLEARGDKQALVEKLIYIGALDERGKRTELSVTGATHAPYIMSNPGHFCCSICDACAPKRLLGSGLFLSRICWLREHYKTTHPGIWGK